jgi:hypothetical protein
MAERRRHAGPLARLIARAKANPAIVAILFAATLVGGVQQIVDIPKLLVVDAPRAVKEVLGLPDCWSTADEYRHPGGSFLRRGTTWIEEPPYAPGQRHTFEEYKRDRAYIYLVDRSRHPPGDPARVMYFRIPVCGGTAQWSYPNPVSWTDVYEVAPVRR